VNLGFKNTKIAGANLCVTHLTRCCGVVSAMISSRYSFLPAVLYLFSVLGGIAQKHTFFILPWANFSVFLVFWAELGGAHHSLPTTELRHYYYVWDMHKSHKTWL
jgi:hypothetical protein